MKWLKNLRVPIIINVICFLAAHVVLVAVLLIPIDAVKQGFFCDDLNIRYPYRTNTVSVSLLVITCAIPAILLILVLEMTYGGLMTRPVSGKEGEANSKCRQGMKTGLGRAALIIICGLYGNCICHVITEIFKLSFGRLRPSFLDACQPATDVTSFSNCSGLFIEDITCLNPDSKLLRDMRKSFVSGHASFVVFNMFFIIMYLHRRLPSSTPRFVAPLLQSVALGYVIFVCASRIHDHYHHPQDVLGGALLGLVTCWVTVFRICPRFIRHPPRTEVDLLPTTIPSINSKQDVNTSAVCSSKD